MKKYEFTGETKLFFGRTLHRIRAVVSFGTVQAGELGGWIEKEENLDHCPFCGGENNRIRKTLKGDDAYYIQCQNCGAKGGVVYVKKWHDTKFIAQGQAAEKWNRRTGDSK